MQVPLTREVEYLAPNSILNKKSAIPAKKVTINVPGNKVA